MNTEYSFECASCGRRTDTTCTHCGRAVCEFCQVCRCRRNPKVTYQTIWEMARGDKHETD